MKFSDEQIHDILKLKDHFLNKIEKYKQEIEMFEKNLGILNSVLKESSFTKASDLNTKQTKSNSTKIPLTRDSSGEIIANAYVTPTQVSIVLKSATETANMLLRIDDVIAISGSPGSNGPSGGPPPMG